MTTEILAHAAADSEGPTLTRRTAVYPGTFDPPTRGHLDIIRRGRTLCDRLVVGVAANPGKGPMFTLEERCAMVRADVAAWANGGGDGLARVEVQPFSTLLMNFAVSQGARLILRGLRAVSDFEYEFQMAGMNAHLNRHVETVFLMASEQTQFISSRFVKEIARLGGDVGNFITANTLAELHRAIAAERRAAAAAHAADAADASTGAPADGLTPG